MKQVIQNLRSGTVGLADVPAPVLHGPGVLVATACSLISPGTERAAVELGRSSLLGKALRRPDQVRKVLASLKREGLRQTLAKVQQRLDVTRALGYSCAGVALETLDCSHVRAGDRVACAGTDAATHAEVNFVPRNLCVPIPAGVSFEEAAFAALGAIALHAVHLGAPQVGDRVAVLGLGPLGLLTAQILRAAGCRVAGLDLRADRLEVAQGLGLDWMGMADPAQIPEMTRSWGVAAGFDAVYIAAAARSTEPAQWAVAAAGDRGRLIVIGDVPTDLPRNDCYAKELSVVYARSYGPGRYDQQYEEGGVDYPRAHVPWTEGRNLSAFLELVAARRVQLAPLITHRFPIREAEQAYAVVSAGGSSLGVLLEYPTSNGQTQIEVAPGTAGVQGDIRVGFIGAGNYAKAYLLPSLQQGNGVVLVNLANSRGVTARAVAEKFGFARCTTDPEDVLRDPDVNVVFIATRHDSHARLAIRALEQSKAVFVEKPLALQEEDLDAIENAWQRNPVMLMVGHNRRFAPATAKVRDFFGKVAGLGGAPLSIRYAVHAGSLPAGHWLEDPRQGGRIVGEVCHFVDWCCAVTGARVERLFAATRGTHPDETLHASLSFADGSLATITYETGSHSTLPKETVHISTAGRSAVMVDFAEVTLLAGTESQTLRFRGKGQNEMVAAFVEGLRSGAAPVPCADWLHSARVTLLLLESAASGLPAWL
jgi:polar amino acid transport system substrate-binding protein